MSATVQLLDHLRSLKPAARTKLARAAGTTVAYLYILAGGHRRASAELALRIQAATRGAVSARELRPDLPWEG